MMAVMGERFWQGHFSYTCNPDLSPFHSCFPQINRQRQMIERTVRAFKNIPTHTLLSIWKIRLLGFFLHIRIFGIELTPPPHPNAHTRTRTDARARSKTIQHA